MSRGVLLFGLVTFALSSPFSVVQVDGEFSLVPRQLSRGGFQAGEMAYGSYNDSVDTIGWGVLEIHTNPQYPDPLASRAAGFLEGRLTAHRIWQNAYNSGITSMKPVPAVTRFYETSLQWMQEMAALAMFEPHTSPDSAYWWQVLIVLEQLQGIFEGYKTAAQPGEDGLTFLDLLFLNAVDEVGDVETGLQAQGQISGNKRSSEDKEDIFNSRGKCSALVKLLDGNSDIMFGHDTWSTLNSMLRIYKLYDFPFSRTNGTTTGVAARRQALSGYPGVVYSADDFYVLSSGLVVSETTIGAENVELYKNYISPLTVPEFIRNTVANRLATSGREWVGMFAKYNSGTYNNMMLVLDYNLFVPGRPLAPETFFICEQIPGFVRSTDVSDRIQRDGYFASYNVPYDPLIRQLSGIEDSVKKYGPWFTYEGSPRALIFKRDQGKVKTIADMKRMMRYNDFKNDPLSSQMPQCDFQNITNCNPSYSSENTIATRCDLNPINGVYAFSMLGHRNHVATDSKITSFKTFNSSTCLAHVISGPTTDQQPAFRWSTSDYAATVPHIGLPDYWDFPWVVMSF